LLEGLLERRISMLCYTSHSHVGRTSLDDGAHGGRGRGARRRPGPLRSRAQGRRGDGGCVRCGPAKGARDGRRAGLARGAARASAVRARERRHSGLGPRRAIPQHGWKVDLRVLLDSRYGGDRGRLQLGRRGGRRRGFFCKQSLFLIDGRRSRQYPTPY